MDVIVVRSNTEANEALELLRSAEVLGCDTETSGLHPSSGKLLSIQFSDGTTNVLIPISEGADAVAFRGLLKDDSVTKVFHNARFDLTFLNAAGLQTSGIFDSMIAEKILTRGADQSISLSETLYRYFAVDLDKSKRKRFGRNWNGAWTSDLVEYAMNDVVHLPRLMSEQTEWLKKLGLERDYLEALETAISKVTSGDTPDDLP